METTPPINLSVPEILAQNVEETNFLLDEYAARAQEGTLTRPEEFFILCALHCFTLEKAQAELVLGLRPSKR